MTLFSAHMDSCLFIITYLFFFFFFPLESAMGLENVVIDICLKEKRKDNNKARNGQINPRVNYQVFY